MTIYKQPGSPYYSTTSISKSADYQASTHLRNKTVAHRVECIKKAELAQRRAGILPRSRFLCSEILQSVFFTPSR